MALWDFCHKLWQKFDHLCLGQFGYRLWPFLAASKFCDRLPQKFGVIRFRLSRQFGDSLSPNVASPALVLPGKSATAYPRGSEIAERRRLSV